MNTNRPTDFKLSATQRHIPEAGHRAFTLTELMVVLLILGILAVLLRPALAGSQQESKSFQCLGNLRRLTQAWTLYAQDNHDVLADNLDYHDNPTTPLGTPSWCEGWLTWSGGANSDNTNTLGLVGAGYSLLGNYVGSNAQVFHCPADVYVSPHQLASGWTNRCRSIAMDMNVGGGVKYQFPGWNAVTNMCGFTLLGPSRSWVLIDEHPDWMDDSMFIINPAQTNGVGEWIEVPASYHNNGCGIGFADGHVEIHKWLDSRIILPVKYLYEQGLGNGLIMPANNPSPDLAWLAQHTPYQQTAW
jgi:prepilin-type N-terminal cleavage/methylation domain-containing protein/prepilin-type processing-associated H-X9-DG protein